MIHPVWQFLFFSEAQRARHTTDFQRNGPTWLHINVHPVVRQLFETGTFCPVSVHQTGMLSYQNSHSLCICPGVGNLAAIPSFTLHQLHTNPDLPQNKTIFFSLAREMECTKKFNLSIPTSTVFSLLLSSGNSLHHLLLTLSFNCLHQSPTPWICPCGTSPETETLLPPAKAQTQCHL